MRKLISLVLALTLIVSMGAFSISASAAGVSSSISQSYNVSTGSTASSRMYVGLNYMPNLIYNEAGSGSVKVTVNAFNYGANYVTVKILDKNYSATATSRYYKGGYYYTNLRVRMYSYDLGRTAGVTSYNAVTELNITIRSRTQYFSGTSFTANLKTQLSAGTIRPVRSGLYLYNTYKTIPFTQCSAISGGISYSNGTSVSVSGSGSVNGYKSVGQMDMYKLYSVRNQTQSGGESWSGGLYSYYYTGDCTLA